MEKQPVNKETIEDGKYGKLYVFSSVLLGIAVTLCLVFAVQVLMKGYVSIGGYSAFRVVTGSMEPTIPVGALLVNQSVDIDEIKVNDIICYRAKEEDHYGATVTHRVIAIQIGEDGRRYLETKGDANYISDIYYVEADNLIGRVIWYSKEESVITNVVSFLGGGIGFFACIVLPVLIIAGMVLQSAVTNLQKELYETERKLREEKSATTTDDELLPGYTTLTRKDYEEIYTMLKEELLGELKRAKEMEKPSTTK